MANVKRLTRAREVRMRAVNFMLTGEFARICEGGSVYGTIGIQYGGLLYEIRSPEVCSGKCRKESAGILLVEST